MKSIAEKHSIPQKNRSKLIKYSYYDLNNNLNLKKKKKNSGFATFTVTSIVKKTKQNLTLSELLEGKKMKEIEKGLKIFDIL